MAPYHPRMSEIADAAGEAIEKGTDSKLNAIIAACVAVTATFLALCNVKDGNIVQAMSVAQTNSVDQWSYYQAKGVKENLAQSTLEQITLQRDVAPTLTPEARKLFDDKIAEQKESIKKYETEKAAIKKQAEDYQREYEALNVHDDQFDMAEALMSVAIALFGVTALTKKRWLLLVAGGFAVFGVFLGVAGFAKLSVHPDFLARWLG